MMDPARRAHYGDFYGAAPSGPVTMVWGNCQAESIRVLLAGSPTFPLPTVRVPPVHELTAEDMAPLAALLPHVSILISQPVRAGYRGLPIGTDDLAGALPAGGRRLVCPIVRYVGLHPYAAIIRDPGDPSGDPPMVPYHDLRTLAGAAGRRRKGEPSRQAITAVAAASVDELARRERVGTGVAVSDLLTSFGSDAVHTLNHPGNGLLIALVQRIQSALGCTPDASDPGRELLGRLSAPLEEKVLEALALDTAPREHWLVDGTIVETAEIRDAHLCWYRQHPACVSAGIRRHAERLAVLQL